MTISRRTFLASSVATMAMPTLGQAGQQQLTASQFSAQILPAGNPKTPVMGFNGSSPGPELRVKQGQAVNVLFQNRLDEGSAVHWHGIRLQNSMDGVPILTQAIVNPGEDFDYRFTPPDAGTFWYHSHYASSEQVERGLYGALIVEDQVSPDVDHDITAIIDDWRLQQDGQFVDDFSNQHDMGHEGRLGNFARAIFSHKTVQQGDRIRLRLINAATARVFPLRLDGLKGKVVALDGMALDAPSKLSQVTLAPAQRVDVIADVVDVPQIVFSSRRGDYFWGEIAVDGYNSTRQPSKIGALPQPNLSKPDLNTPHRLTLDMQGGAMGGRHNGTDIWAFNDVSGLPPKPFAVFRSGETAKISLVNSTAFPHGIHLHGQHFFELDDDGLLGVFRDTTLVDAGQSRDIACVFDNPGRWLLHCHMLGHQAAGMRTWIEVV